MTRGVLLLLAEVNCALSAEIWVYFSVMIAVCALLFKKESLPKNAGEGAAILGVFVLMGMAAWGLDVLLGFVVINLGEGCFFLVDKSMSPILSFLIFPCLAIAYAGSLVVNVVARQLDVS